MTNQFPGNTRTTPDLPFVLKYPIKNQGWKFTRLFLFARHSSLFSECLRSFLMPGRCQVVNMSPFIPNDTPTLLMTHSTNLALDLPLLDLGPAQLLLMRENCRQGCDGFCSERREAPRAPNSHVCVCFRKAGALLRCASEPRSHGTGM